MRIRKFCLVRKMPVRGLYGNRECHVPFWFMIYLTSKFRFNAIVGLSLSEMNFYFNSK